MTSLSFFSPIRKGGLELSNRSLAAPLTRMRADSAKQVLTAPEAEYYAQLVSAGLIMAATATRSGGFGWADTPGLWSPAPVTGGRRVTNHSRPPRRPSAGRGGCIDDAEMMSAHTLTV